MSRVSIVITLYRALITLLLSTHEPSGSSIAASMQDLWKGPNGEYVALTKVEAVPRIDDCFLTSCPGIRGYSAPDIIIPIKDC